MVSTKRLVQMVRKWQKMAALGRRKIMMMSTRVDGDGESKECSTITTASVARKGHVFVYTVDGNRFMIPLQYLSSDIFRELLEISEEEFGLPSDGPITLPCDGPGMEYVLSLLRLRISRDVERAVLTSAGNGQCPAYSVRCGHNQQYQHIVCSF